MTTALAKQRIRLQVDPYTKTAAVDQMTNAAPHAWRGADLQIEIGIFSGGTIIDDLDNIVTLALDILPGGSTGRSSNPLYQDTIDNADLTVCLSAAWIAKTGSHAIFEIAKEDMQFAMTLASDNRLSLWLVIHAIDDDGQYITLGGANLTVEEDGAQNGLTVVGGSDTVRSLAGQMQCKNPDTDDWHNVDPVVIGGILQLVVDQDAAT